MSDCIFCKIVAGGIPSQKIYEDSDILAFNDINPQAPVHIVIIPRKHISKIHEADGQEALLGNLMNTAGRIAEKTGILETGYRIVINTNRDAGQTVDHIHLHLLGGRKLEWPPG